MYEILWIGMGSFLDFLYLAIIWIILYGIIQKPLTRYAKGCSIILEFFLYLIDDVRDFAIFAYQGFP